MDKRRITESAIDLIDIKYVKNAISSLDSRQKKKIASHKNLYIMVAIVTAILLVIASAWILHSLRGGNHKTPESPSYIPSSEETEFVADVSTDPSPVETERTTSNQETTSATEKTRSVEEPVISAEIRVNRILSKMNTGYRYYPESIYDFIPKSLVELSAYFGKDLTKISYLQNYSILHITEFIYTKTEGKLVFDISHVVYEGASKTITISMSKMMKPYDCFYLYDEDQYSIIEGMQVLIGENAEGTHVVADFETDEVFYRVQMDGIIDLDLLVKCISELIR